MASPKINCNVPIQSLWNFSGVIYHIVGKFGKFGESSLICQTKIIQISTYNYNLLAESIHSPNFFSPSAQNE